MEPDKNHLEQSASTAARIHRDSDFMGEQNIQIQKHYESQFEASSFRIWCDHRAESVGGHLDVHLYPPLAGRDHLTLATVGMSAKNMRVTENLGDEEEIPDPHRSHIQRAELLLYLPSNWDFGSPDGMTPVTFLRNMATYPHRNKTWLGRGHTIPLSETLPLFLGSLMTHAFLSPPYIEETYIAGDVGEDISDDDLHAFRYLELTDGAGINFYWLHGVTMAERYIHISNGSKELEKLLLIDRENFRLDIDRECLVSAENRTERRARARAQNRRLRAPQSRPWWNLPCQHCGANAEIGDE